MNNKKVTEFDLHESEARTAPEKNYRRELADYFEESIGTTMDKLDNFAKYIPRQILTHFLAKYEIFKRIQSVHGAIVECGVFLGGGLMTWAQLSSIFEPVYHMGRIIGFDTFEGFRDLHEEDRGSAKSEHMKIGGCGADSYRDLLECIRLYDKNRFIGHHPKVELVKGDIRDTLPEYMKANPHLVVRLLYLDLDLYEPTKVALEHLVPRMPKGAVLAFDELANAMWPGETKAVLEVVGLKNLRIERSPFHSALSFAVIE
ncbi:MAG: TylF/MycF/NovP-related O-methyltransferase [Candidatus Auribacterota bacterium]|nr:TylF/MycF/NovP-related O-methyltransferase [Candidatus Auribacterota bacterium]